MLCRTYALPICMSITRVLRYNSLMTQHDLVNHILFVGMQSAVRHSATIGFVLSIRLIVYDLCKHCAVVFDVQGDE